MTDVTPPPELVKQWATASPVQSNDENWAYEFFIAHHAAQWGADQELEACVKLLELSDKNARDFLYSARRPKPPSAKEQALFALAVLTSADETCSIAEIQQHWHTIRRALEQLDD
jgi:hypothetical protein